MTRPRKTNRRPGDAPKKPTGDGDPLRDASHGQRIQKVLAFAGVASRRDCEALVTNGRVSVNGKPVTTLPAWVDPWRDRILVNGIPIPKPAHNPRDRYVYIALNKPRRVISTAHDPEDRRTVTELVDLPPDLAERVFPVGRLSADASGLILLTNDGELANRLTHARYGIAKRYLVTVKGRLTGADVDAMNRLITHAPPPKRGPQEDAASAPAEIRDPSATGVTVMGYDQGEGTAERTKLMVTLREGHNREVRTVMFRLGLKVHRLQRVAIGSLMLKGLASGKWRQLTPPEVAKLREETGMRHRSQPSKTKRA
ncbi:MAG: rRNA pseudouridine synthase [Planctomycetes bacterium]|nr:rRNA pseudouridine synthase [Planctomycetota bacterium]